MSSSQLTNSLGEIVTTCPFCKAHVVLQIQTIDLNIYANKLNDVFAITLKKSISKTPANEVYIKSLLINSLKKKPFIARVVTTRAYQDVIDDLIRTGFLTDKDLKNINNLY